MSADVVTHRPTSCPGEEVLRSLLEGELADVQVTKLSAHLDSCSRCQTRLDALTDSSELVPVSRLSLPAEAPEVLREVMRRVQRSTAPPSVEDSAAECDLSFLRPAQLPGSLGRFGPYEVLEVLGRGGMGIVLKALDPKLNRQVAIKLLAPELSAQKMARQRFIREAQAAAVVNHDHVVTIHAVDEIDSLPCLVMSYVVGGSLQERVQKSGPLELGEVVRIGEEIATGLAAAHDRGLVHRDIKPANILLEESTGRVKIADFGLAKVVGDASITESGLIAGTPHYMAPEQARAEQVDHRADLFALGCVLYFMCTARPPFPGKSTPVVLRKVCDEEPPAIRELNAGIPGSFVRVIQRLLEKDPRRRYRSAHEVAQVLGRHRAAIKAAATQPGRGGGTPLGRGGGTGGPS